MQLPRVAKIIAQAIPITYETNQDHMPRGLAWRRNRRREQSTYGRSLARQLLQKATGVSSEDWTFATDADGRPIASWGDGNVGPDFSISHCTIATACAVTLNGRIGVDVEQTRTGRQYADIARMYFTLEEQHLTDSQGEAGFFACWTLREAVAKATGKGLAGALAITGDWIVPAQNTTRVLAIEGRTWIVGHRSSGPLHLAMAWQPTAELHDNEHRQMANELDVAASNLNDVIGRHAAN
jgi:4'-phosphopantetheinyl transferase